METWEGDFAGTFTRVPTRPWVSYDTAADLQAAASAADLSETGISEDIALNFDDFVEFH
jgi:hypothetical protein